jgi:hypothetical protein
VHLFVALGHVPPPRPIEYLYGGTFQTHDGPMPTGALLVRSLLTPGSLLRSLPSPAFGTQASPFWEGPVFTAAVARLAASPADHTVVVRLSGGFGHAFHYHLHAAGARYENGPGDAVNLWGDAIRLRLGQTRVFTIGNDTPAYRALNTLDVQPGDDVWLLGDPGQKTADMRAKLPPGLALQARPSFDEHFTTFVVVRAESAPDRQEGGT